MTYDVRLIANVVLDRAFEKRIQITNLALNKILYFVHAHYLVHIRKPLIREDAEAWDHGPVYREIYRQFNEFDASPITTRAKRLDLVSGKMIEFAGELDEMDRPFALTMIDFYSPIPGWKLRELSHASGGPWDQTWNHSGPSNPGMIISNESIANYFRTNVVAGEGNG